MTERGGGRERGGVRRPLEQIAELRALTGLTQGELADYLGVQQAAVSKLERRDNPSIRALRAYVGALGGQVVIEIRLRGRVFELIPKAEEPPDSR